MSAAPSAHGRHWARHAHCKHRASGCMLCRWLVLRLVPSSTRLCNQHNSRDTIWAAMCANAACLDARQVFCPTGRGLPYPYCRCHPPVRLAEQQDLDITREVFQGNGSAPKLFQPHFLQTGPKKLKKTLAVAPRPIWRVG